MYGIYLQKLNNRHLNMPLLLLSGVSACVTSDETQGQVSVSSHTKYHTFPDSGQSFQLAK